MPAGTPTEPPTPPVQTPTAPPATATPTATASPTPSATGTTGGAEAPAATARGLREDEGGDEQPIGVPVTVRVTPSRIRVVGDATVPAFLPLRVRVISTLDDPIRLRVIQAGGDGRALGAGRVAAGGRTAFPVGGAQPGSLEILSPDLNPDRTAFLTVER